MSEPDLSCFSHAIVRDDGSRVLTEEGDRFDADELVRLTETELGALRDYDRVVTRGATGQKLIVEMIPDDPCRRDPIEIRDCEEVVRDE